MSWEKWRKDNPERYKEMMRDNQRAYRSRLTPEEKRAIRAKWKNNKRAKMGLDRPPPSACEVCGVKGPVVFDHCHAKETFRGWLCNGCNTALGMVKDNPDILIKLAEYLSRG